MCQSFERRGYPYPMVNEGKPRAREIDRDIHQRKREDTRRIPLTFRYHRHKLTGKNIFIQKTFYRTILRQVNVFTPSAFQTRQKHKKLSGQKRTKTRQLTENLQMHTLTLQNSSFHPKTITRSQNLTMHLYSCHLLHNLYTMQKNVHRRNR